MEVIIRIYGNLTKKSLKYADSAMKKRINPQHGCDTNVLKFVFNDTNVSCDLISIAICIKILLMSEDVFSARRAKLENLRESGDPYPNDLSPTIKSVRCAMNTVKKAVSN